jgi:hypothetical protein
MKAGGIICTGTANWRIEHFQAKWNHLAARKMRSNKAFSSQVESLGGSENAIKQSIFNAKWNHLATRKMRSNKGF